MAARRSQSDRSRPDPDGETKLRCRAVSSVGRTHSGSAVLRYRKPVVEHGKRLRSKGWVVPEPRPTEKVLRSIKISPHHFIVAAAAQAVVIQECFAISKPHP